MQTFRAASLVVVVPVLIAAVGCWKIGAKPRQVDPRVSASVVYKRQMLVLSNKDGAAAIAFDKEIEYGVKYRYRYLTKDGGEGSGKDKVFEKYKELPGGRPGEVNVVDDGGKLILRTGPLHVEWSFAEAGKGYVAYYPDRVRVQIADAADFEKIDLARFVPATTASKTAPTDEPNKSPSPPSNGGH